jgi:hypothetical protein
VTNLKGKEWGESEGKERVAFEWGFGREGREKGKLLGFLIASFRWKWRPKKIRKKRKKKRGRQEMRRGGENDSTGEELTGGDSVVYNDFN